MFCLYLFVNPKRFWFISSRKRETFPLFGYRHRKIFRSAWREFPLRLKLAKAEEDEKVSRERVEELETENYDLEKRTPSSKPGTRHWRR
jgi:hypothetical protein